MSTYKLHNSENLSDWSSQNMLNIALQIAWINVPEIFIFE